MTQISQKILFLNAFNLIPELGPVKLGLISREENLEKLWMNNNASAFERLGLDAKTAAIVIKKKMEINPEQSLNALEKFNIRCLLASDPDYPALLKEIANPPPLLYMRGRAEALAGLLLGVVGSRKISVYGQQAVAALIPQLASQGFTIVSGLAFGVDAEALNTVTGLGAPSIAVLVTPLDDLSISPRTNFALAQKIMDQGCLVSEHPLGAGVQKQNFPVRNRLISGLSVGTLVIEAGDKSGSLITAGYALEQNRAVFAVPGSIFSELSKGTNGLIKRGARMVISASDILEDLNLDLHPINSTVNLKSGSAQEQSVLTALTRTGKSLEDIILETKLPASEINIALSLLELAGRVKNLGNGIYVKIF